MAISIRILAVPEKTTDGTGMLNFDIEAYSDNVAIGGTHRTVPLPADAVKIITGTVGAVAKRNAAIAEIQKAAPFFAWANLESLVNQNDKAAAEAVKLVSGFTYPLDLPKP